MMLLSLHEPWSTLMAMGLKKIETRDWLTSYRGPLAIHTSKIGMGLQATLDTCLEAPFFNALLADKAWSDAVLGTYRNGVGHPNHVPKSAMKAAFPNRGKIVAVVQLLDVVPTAKIWERYPRLYSPQELAFGNYDEFDADSARPRHGWVTEMLFRLPEPVEFSSKQGLVHVPQEVHQELKRQWNLANK